MKNFLKITLSILFLLLVSACQSTQKTYGEGLVSVVSQNVVKLAGNSAITQADFSSIKGKKILVELTGFVEERTKGFIDNLVSSNAEKEGARLIRSGDPDILVEVVVNSAGNDQGTSRIPVINRALRTESVVDLTLIFRDPSTGSRISTQDIRGEAKYEQKRWVGIIDESGKYYIKSSSVSNGNLADKVRSDITNDEWILVDRP
ncbi:hypothetical protein M9B42_05240 [SAR86 cluster bacterium]|jgi:hypothetical protein|nr:hypothetical protein M9B42_05240 [SAR86 cluster bacterium]